MKYEELENLGNEDWSRLTGVKRSIFDKIFIS